MTHAAPWSTDTPCTPGVKAETARLGLEPRVCGQDGRWERGQRYVSATDGGRAGEVKSPFEKCFPVRRAVDATVRIGHIR